MGHVSDAGGDRKKLGMNAYSLFCWANPAGSDTAAISPICIAERAEEMVLGESWNLRPAADQTGSPVNSPCGMVNAPAPDY